MATINNNGIISYTLNGTRNELQSNTVSTNLNITYAASVIKTASPDTFAPGDIIKYQIRVNNDGTGSLYLPQITDDLGYTTGTSPIGYVSDSASGILYDTVSDTAKYVEVTATQTLNGILFTVDAVILRNNILILTYDTVVNDELSNSVLSITNNVEFDARQGSVDGAELNASASETITRRTVSIVKNVDKTEVEPGDVLTYTFALSNETAYLATLDNLTDDLPENFVIGNTITAMIGSEQVIYNIQTDYTVSADNQLILAPAASSVPLTIPAATGSAPGVTTITITGTITA